MAEDQQAGPGLYVKIGLNMDGMLGGIGGVSIALNQALELFSKFEGAAQQFVDLAISAGRFGKEVKDNARDLGLSTKEFQQWSHVAVAAGSSAENITGAIRMMSVRMKDAADPTSEMGKALSALGVRATDSSGKMRSMNDVLLDVFPALNALPEGFNRNQVAMTLFGRGFTNIADLASLSRGELQQLIDQAPVFSDQKIQQLNAFNTQMTLLNERMERSKILIGSEMVSSFSTWGNAIDYGLQKGHFLIDMFRGLNLTLEMTAEGLVLLGARTQAFLTLDLFTEKGKKQIAEADAAVAEMMRKFRLAESGYFDGARWNDATKSWEIAADKIESIGTQAEDSAKSIQALQRTMEDLDQSITDTQLSLQSAGMDQRDSLEEYNRLLKERDTEALQADPETSGGIKHAERVKEIDKELERLALKINVNNQTITKGFRSLERDREDLVSIMVAGDTKIVNSLQARVEVTAAQNTALDTIESTHWQTVTDLARISYDAIIGYMVEAVNFAGANPIIQNVVLMTANGPNWNPPAFTPLTAGSPLSNPDFSKALRTPAPVAATTTNQTAGKSVSITVNQTNYGVETDADGMNRSLGKIASLTGAGG